MGSRSNLLSKNGQKYLDTVPLKRAIFLPVQLKETVLKKLYSHREVVDEAFPPGGSLQKVVDSSLQQQYTMLYCTIYYMFTLGHSVAAWHNLY